MSNLKYVSWPRNFVVLYSTLLLPRIGTTYSYKFQRLQRPKYRSELLRLTISDSCEGSEYEVEADQL